MITRRLVTIPALLLFVVGAWGIATAKAPNTCTGSGVVAGGQTNGSMTCSGTCSGSTCAGAPTGMNTDPTVSPSTFLYCTCTPGTEPACCHMRGHYQGDGSTRKFKKFLPYGNCLSCPASGLCQVVVHHGSSIAACLNP